MDTALPVWTIRPNWKDGILERLDWLTDVLTSETGAEQRRALRLSPRRSFEITVNPTRNERTYLDLWLQRLGSQDMLAPIWHDKARLTGAAALAGDRLNFDNRWREHQVGGFAILYFDTWKWEVVQIAAQDDTGLDLALPLDAAWPKGTVVYPLRKMRLAMDSSISALTSRVGESILLFTVAEANDWPEIMPMQRVYGGVPVIWPEPNRSDEITTDHTRLASERDNQTGLVYRSDQAARAFGVQSHNWQLRGRQAQCVFRSNLYWMRGRARAVWLPTFNDDIIVSDAAAPADTRFNIEKVGLGYTGGIGHGREYVSIGDMVLKLASMGVAPSPDKERLVLAGSLPGALPKGRPGSFLDAARLDQDTIELHHHADSDGMLEVTAGFRAFNNVRDPSGPTYNAIPDAIQDEFGCGVTEGEQNNPCRRAIFTGVYLTVVFTAPNPCNPNHTGNRLCYVQDIQPNGPGGKGVGGFEDDFGGLTEYHTDLYENIVADNPRLQGQLLRRFTSYTFNHWKMEYYFPGAVFAGVTVFPSSFYCSPVGKDHGTGLVVYQYFDGPPVNLGEKDIAGNSGNTWG